MRTTIIGRRKVSTQLSTLWPPSLCSTGYVAFRPLLSVLANLLTSVYLSFLLSNNLDNGYVRATTIPTNDSILDFDSFANIIGNGYSTQPSQTKNTEISDLIDTTPHADDTFMDIGLNKNDFLNISPPLVDKHIDIALHLNVNPSNLVVNCTDIELRCQIVVSDSETQNIPNSSSIWWTFQGNNISASTLPGGRVTNENWNVSVLNIGCAQFGVHNGDYKCQTADSSETELSSVTSSEIISLDIYLPLKIDSIQPANGTVRETIDSQVQMKCFVLAYPKPKIIWQRTNLATLTVSDIEEDGRILIDNKFHTENQSPHSHTATKQVQMDSRIPITTVESVLTFKTLMRSDNGSYTCKVLSFHPFEKPLLSHFNVIVLEVPEIHIEKLEIENKTTAIVSFIVDYDGNLHLDQYLLEIMNYSVINASWTAQNVPINLIVSNHNYSSVQIHNLMPGANYGFRLAAQNKVGPSVWNYMNISIPPDVPSTIINVHLLSKTNETLLFGWRRPLFDNGGIINQYQMVLKDSNNSLVANQTLDITNSGIVQSRNNYMYMFPNLIPGSHYNFQVRACSHIGCSDWSSVLDAVTSDGHSDPPLNIRLKCTFDSRTLQNNATITWGPPNNPRGSIIAYNITLEGHANYKNVHNRFVLDQFRQSYEVMGTTTFRHHVSLKPNSNYTVRLCAINKSGCGQFSHITSSSMCQSAPTTPSEFPPNIKFERFKPAIINNNEVRISPFSPSHQLKLNVPRISERNGPIKCYRVIMVRLPAIQLETNNSSINVTRKIKLFDKYLANGPESIILTTYKHVSEIKGDEIGAYIAKEFSSEDFKSEIIIGDGKTERCYEDSLEYDLKSRIKSGYLQEENRSPRRINYDLNVEMKNESITYSNRNLVEDGELVANTNYTCFIEVTVLTWNKTILVLRSPFIDPVETEPFHLIIPELSKSTFSETATGILFGTIFGLVLVIILLFSVLCFLKRKATETSAVILEDERIGLTSIIRRTIGVKRKNSLFYQINCSSVNSIKKWASKPIPVQNLLSAFQEKHANSDFLFQAEFEALPEEFPDRTTVQSDAPENVSKNRYPDIKSYDQTRVHLSKIDNTPGSDYINADFVNGYKNQKQFICAQGPIQKTIGDFWRLVYEQKCSIIVMLTGIEEQGRIKCAQYWSETEAKEVTSNLTVIPQCRRDYSDYVIRRFTLENSDTKETRDILHFHFIAWKDFLAPEQPSWLLRFIKRVNEHHCPDRGPILVHCSAGVGRTGTFIAIDTLICQIDDGSTHINIFDCVSKLRYQRNFLVQSIKQYIFVYRAIMEYIEFGDTEVEVSHLSDHYKQLKDQKFDCGNGIIMEFEKLNEVLEDPKSIIVGTMDMNTIKNRYSFIIPYDINRVILNPSSSKDHSYYINASCIQGYDHLLSFIVAQDPMEHTVGEFWWMIAEHNVTTLVMLAELGEGQSKCHCYWPTEELDCDYVKVKMVEEEMSQYYTKRVFSVTQKKTNNSHKVDQYQFLAWKSGVVPESTTSLIQLTDIVLANNSNSLSPILVHCSGGGDRSSVFVAFASLVKQLKLEERVDIFQTARYVKSQRQCMLQTIAQYDFLYRCVIDYIDYHHICNSGDTQL